MAHEILVSAHGPLVLGFCVLSLGFRGLGPRLDNKHGYQVYFGSDTNDKSTPDSFLTVSALFFTQKLESHEEDSDDEEESL